MNAIANTAENNAIVSSLKKVKETRWVGTTTFTTMQECLTAINLYSGNSGWYNPKAIKINGLVGWFMINQNGSIFFESRIIKERDDLYKVEHLTNEGFDDFEQHYNTLIN